MSRALLGRSRSRHGGSAFSSCPNFARATKCPIPGDATSLSFSTRALQARAGHASFSATSLYIDLAGEAFRGEAELLERRLLRVEDSGRKSPSVTSMPRQEREAMPERDPCREGEPRVSRPALEAILRELRPEALPAASRARAAAAIRATSAGTSSSRRAA